MDDEKFALYTFGLSLLASIAYALTINLGGFNGLIGVVLLFALVIFILFSDRVSKAIL